MPKANTPSSVPLICSICPKMPRFSDMSHMLTHISSKAHLSQKFKLEISSQNDMRARMQLSGYDEWYDQYGLDTLLSDRLAAKENKKAPKRSRSGSVAVKSEASSVRSFSSTSSYRPPAPRMHLWATAAHARRSETPAEDKDEKPNAYETPNTRRRLPGFPIRETPRTFGEQPNAASDFQTTPSRGDDTEDEEIKDNSKLKGILWPGMDLFDSATAEMKKKRNQKKDGSVLHQMKINSKEVVPSEWVFESDGSLRKIRSIFAVYESDDSPEKSEPTPAHKKRRGRKSATTGSPNEARLGEPPAFVNPQRVMTRRQTAALAASSAEKLKAALNPLSSNYPKFTPSAEENREFKMTLEDMSKHRNHGLFEEPEVSPGRTESPLEDPKFDLTPGMFLRPSRTNAMATFASPTPVHKPLPMRMFDNKENTPTHHDQFPTMSAMNGYSSQPFREPPYNPLYSQNHSQSFAYGDQASFQNEYRPPVSNFHGEYKPYMMAPQLQVLSAAAEQSQPLGTGGYHYH